jgi:hypothetical protein
LDGEEAVRGGGLSRVLKETAGADHIETFESCKY